MFCVDEEGHPRKCSFCGKLFSSAGNRRKHERVIHGMKSYGSTTESDVGEFVTFDASSKHSVMNVIICNM
jgi:hypothetical protein